MTSIKIDDMADMIKEKEKELFGSLALDICDGNSCKLSQQECL